MSLLQGDPLPNITTTKSTATQGPEWYGQYLQSLAQPGQAMMGKTGEELIAPMSSLQTGALSTAPDALSRYESLMGQATTDATAAAKGVTPEMVQSFMSPYTTGVVDEMSRLSQQNMQRNLMPTLKAAFAGTGGTGSQRMMGALGQLGADVQANLTGQQTGALQKGYSDAVNAALQQAGLLQKGALGEQAISSADLAAAKDQLSTMYGLGEKQQAFDQSKILAPVAAAKSAADVYANLKVPTTVSETANAPIPGAYATSPLAQIAGLGSLFASGSGGTSAVQGVLNTLFGTAANSAANQGLLNWLAGKVGDMNSTNPAPSDLSGYDETNPSTDYGTTPVVPDSQPYVPPSDLSDFMG